MLGLWLLLACVLVFVLITVVLVARGAEAKTARRRADAQFRQAFGAPDPPSLMSAVRQIALQASGSTRVSGEALVLAARATQRREVIPVLVALLAHRSPEVAQAANLALNDLGAPGLRAVWDGLRTHPESRQAGVGFLANHPDWLFERLLEAFVQAGDDGVTANLDLWRLTGMRHRLELLAQGSDAVNRLRAHHIRGLIGTDGNRVA